MIVFLDTETTGVHNRDRVVRLAAMTSTGARFDALVHPDGWEIPEEATAIHGITLQMCEEAGILMPNVLRSFQEMTEGSLLWVAHNVAFDVRMLRGEAARYGMQLTVPATYCTMHKARAKCKKLPTLTEALAALCNRTHRAHDAMEDVVACRDVFLALQQPEPLELRPVDLPHVDAAEHVD